MKIAIATCSKIPRLKEDERYLITAFSETGIVAVPKVWNDVTVNWGDYNAVVIRTIWDYHLHIEQFFEWLSQLDRLGVTTINSSSLLRWNCHKFYLKELQNAGVRIPKTLFLSKNEQVSEIPSEWDTFVVKPAISATAYETHKVSQGQLGSFRSRLEKLSFTSDLLIQEFVPEICDQGEWSLIYLKTDYSHAVLKQVSKSEYRVQAEFGGTVQMLDAPVHLIEFGYEVLSKIPERSAFARIDCIDTQMGPILMEAELIEPELFLNQPQYQQKFLQALLHTL